MIGMSFIFLPHSLAVAVSLSLSPSFYYYLTTLFLVRHSHDVHSFDGVLELLGVVDAGHGQVAVGEELVALWIIKDEFRLASTVHAIQHLVEDVEGPLIGSLVDSTRLLQQV